MLKYLLITLRTPNFNPDDLPGHYTHLAQLENKGVLQLSGPFSDKTGGAYLIEADSLEVATQIGYDDPIIKSGSSTLIIKEWNI